MDAQVYENVREVYCHRHSILQLHSDFISVLLKIFETSGLIASGSKYTRLRRETKSFCCCKFRLVLCFGTGNACCRNIVQHGCVITSRWPVKAINH